MPFLPTRFARWPIFALCAAVDRRRHPARGRRLARVARRGRAGVWNETGILDTLPPGGLAVRWRTPIHAGYAGPAVAGGRVFVTDSRRIKANQAIERALALDEQTGQRSLDAGMGDRTTAACSWSTRSVRARRRPSTAIASTCSGAMGQAARARREERPRALAEGLRQGLQCLGPDLGHGRRAAGRRRSADLPRRRRARRQGDRPRQAHGRGNLARAVVGHRARLQPADHHRGGRRAAARSSSIPRASARSIPRPARCSGKSSTACRWGLSWRRRCTAAAICSSPRSTAARGCSRSTSDKPPRPVLWSGPGEQDPGMTHDTPDTLNSVISTPVIDGELRLRARQRRPAAVPRRGHRQAGLEDRRAAQGARDVRHGILRQQRRPLLHQQRPRRAGDRQALAEGLRGDQPHQADRADAPVRPAPPAARTCSGRTPPTPTGTSSSATTTRSSASRSPRASRMAPRLLWTGVAAAACCSPFGALPGDRCPGTRPARRSS